MGILTILLHGQACDMFIIVLAAAALSAHKRHQVHQIEMMIDVADNSPLVTLIELTSDKIVSSAPMNIVNQ